MENQKRPIDSYRIKLGYPDFPEHWEQHLSPGVEPRKVNKSCICYLHAPELWTSRFGDNPPFTGFEPPMPIEDIPKSVTLRRSCDYRIPTALFEANLQRLMDARSRGERLTDSEENAAHRFLLPWKAWLDYRSGEKFNKPDLSAMMKSLNKLLFGGCLGNINFHWAKKEEHATSAYGWTTYDEDSDEPTVFIVHEQHGMDKPETELLSTMLYELVHVYIWRFYCRGEREHCHTQNRTPLAGFHEFAPLCKYMYARCIANFTSVAYEGELFEVGLRRYGHGAVFQRLVRMLSMAVPVVLGSEFTYGMRCGSGEIVCTCQAGNSGCLFHCYYTHREMQKWGKHRIRKQNAARKKPQEEEKEDEGMGEDPEEPSMPLPNEASS